jgi:hypothetical protein
MLKCHCPSVKPRARRGKVNFHFRKKQSEVYHFHNFYFGVNTQIVERNFEILLHLNGIIFELSDSKETHLAMSPSAVLPQQEWQQHQQASVVNDPPDIDKSADLFNVNDKSLSNIFKKNRNKLLTFSVDSGKKLIPLGTIRAILLAAVA